jgi:pilus assembly protein CpaB
VLTQGTRALTIPVAGAAGGTGMMFPGDHVDVMLTQTFKNDDAPLTRRSVSETVVDNLRVLAIDMGTKPGASANAISVTLEVLPQQAEKVNVAQELGKLSLTLRSLDEPGIAAAPTWAGDVSPALTSAVRPTKVIQTEKPGIKVMRGPNSIDTKAE